MVLLSSFASPASAQTLRGLLLERDSYQPINLGNVTLVTTDGDTVAATITDQEGFFSLDAPREGEYFLYASALGYRSVRSDPIEVEDGMERVLQLDMAPEPVALRGLTVETDRPRPLEVPGLLAVGFYDRMLEGRGEFITPDEIAASPAEHTPQLFWTKKTVAVRPGDRVGMWNDDVLVWATMGGLCSPRIYVDGVWVREFLPGEALADVVPRDEIEGVEIYHAMNAPLRYLGTSECGVILFWTLYR